MVAGPTPFLVNDSTQQNLQALEQQFPHAQPRQSYAHDRLQPTIENALKTFLDNNDNNTNTLKRCRIILVTVAKQSTEKAFEYMCMIQNICKYINMINC
jgi:hypothetical protein